MKNLLTRLGEQYVGVNICVTIETHAELERIFRILLDGMVTIVDVYYEFGRAVKYGSNFLLDNADIDYPCVVALLNGELSLHTRYITPDFGSLSLADFIELFT